MKFEWDYCANNAREMGIAPGFHFLGIGEAFSHCKREPNLGAGTPRAPMKLQFPRVSILSTNDRPFRGPPDFQARPNAGCILSHPTSSTILIIHHSIAKRAWCVEGGGYEYSHHPGQMNVDDESHQRPRAVSVMYCMSWKRKLMISSSTSALRC